MCKEKGKVKYWSIFLKVILTIVLFFYCSKDVYATEQLYWPVPTVPKWSTYGTLSDPHTGIDIVCSRGTNVYAAKEGTVLEKFDSCTHDDNVQRKCCGTYGIGNGLFIQHDDGTIAEYAHMKLGSFQVNKGDRVNKGQLLGQVASTGNSSGPHLHFGIRMGDLKGRHFTDFWDFPLIDVSPCGGEVIYENVTFTQPEFSNIIASNITDKTALVKADVNISNIDPDYFAKVGVKWGISRELSNKAIEFSVGSKLSYVSVAFDDAVKNEGPSLSPGTTYYYKFYLKSIYGKEILESPIYSFTTSGEKVPEVITKISYDNVYVKSLTDTKATVRAEVTADVSMYKEAGIYWGTTSDTTEKVGFDTSKNSKLTFIEVAFDGSEGPTLSRGTTYYYRFYAVRNDDTVDVDYTLRSFTTTGDNTPPQITSAYTQEVNGDGYTIICTVSDDVGVSRVCCPTWTEANGQDDLFDDWYNTAVATQIDDNTYMYYVSTAEHNNEWGKYISHIYGYDASGNNVNVEVTQSVYLVDHNLSPEFPLVDGGVYKIRSVGSGKVIDVPSGSSNNFEILHQWENCAAESQKWKAVQMEDGYAFVSVNSEKAMSIPDYSEYAETRLTQYDFDLEHSQIFKLIHRGDGKYSIHPICSDMALDVHGGSMDNGAEIMQYFYFGSDNQLWTFELLDTEKPVIKRAIAYNIDVNGYDLTCDVTDNVEVERVCFPTWTVANGQDDLAEDWYETTKATNVSGNRYAFHVDVADHNYEYGEYVTHAYAFDTSGNCMTIEWSIDVPKPIKGITFDKTVVNMEVGEKEILNLTISPADADDQTIYWKSDNTAVATIEPTGEITAVGPGKATITATTGDGSNLSVSCVVTVFDKLTIDTQPTSASVNEGSNAVFKVAVNNSYATYQWQFKSAGSDYWADSTMTGSNTNSITVKATTARNGYQYRCVVKDSYGNKVTSNVATLTVISVQKVQITSQPVSATVSEGANATFKVAATGSNLTYQWQFKNATATYWTDSTMAGATTNSITVKGTTARNGYQYRCVVKDGSGNKVTSNAAKLTVNKAISITGQPASASVNEGANATFKVTATGSNLTYQWQFKNATATYWSDSTMAGATTNSITVKGTTARNGYQYRCVVKDANGNKVTSNAAKLTVVQGQSVKVTGQPASQVVLEGENATFKVTASGTGLTYQWQFKNASSDYWSNSSMTGSNTNSITVKATNARNSYQYRCVVKDGNGNKVTSNAATLTVVQGQGVKITGQPASQTVTAGNSATFKVTASGSGLTYQWQFKSTANNYWADSTMAGSKTNSITVQGTTARNGYQYRCVVKDSNGNKVTSNAAKLIVK